jgi:hypothetical protein
VEPTLQFGFEGNTTRTLETHPECSKINLQTAEFKSRIYREESLRLVFVFSIWPIATEQWHRVLLTELACGRLGEIS